MATQHVHVGSKVGAHARSAPVIAERASQSQEEILIEPIDSPEPDNEPADASSTLMLMTLGAGYGGEVVATSTNAVTVEKIAQLIAQDLSD